MVVFFKLSELKQPHMFLSSLQSYHFFHLKYKKIQFIALWKLDKSRRKKQNIEIWSYKVWGLLLIWASVSFVLLIKSVFLAESYLTHPIVRRLFGFVGCHSHKRQEWDSSKQKKKTKRYFTQHTHDVGLLELFCWRQGWK